MTLLKISTEPQNAMKDLDSSDAPAGVDFRVSPVMNFAVGAPEIFLATATLAMTVPVNVFSNWLYAKLVQKKAQQAYINQSQVPLDEEQIRRVVAEEIEKQKPRSAEQKAGDSKP